MNVYIVLSWGSGQFDRSYPEPNEYLTTEKECRVEKVFVNKKAAERFVKRLKVKYNPPIDLEIAIIKKKLCGNLFVLNNSFMDDDTVKKYIT